jgi:uncharacterized membrane protein
MTLRRLAVLQWVGLLLGGSFWFAYHLAGYGLTEATCDSVGWNIHHDLWQALAMTAAAAFVLGAQAAALLVIRRTRETSYEDEPPLARMRFAAIAAAVANVIFFMIIVLDGVGSIFNVACRQG